MKARLAILFSVLILRLVVNFVVVSRYRLGEPVRVRFDHYKTERLGADCIIKAGWFWARNKEFCFQRPRQAIVVSGRISAGLIDRLMGRIWLDRSSYYMINEGKERAESENLRARLSEAVLARLPSPEGELVLGIVLGYKSVLPKLFYDQLVRSGTVHIVVASGYNVMVVAGLALSLMLPFWRRRLATLAAIGVVWLYVLLAGGEVSLLRAALMGSAVLIGLAWGRSARIIWSLALTVGVMLVISPSLTESVSFQLSVAATFGVAVVGPFLKNRWGRDDPIDLTTTLGALAMTAPLIWWHFGRLSWISLVSNSLILPLVPILMLLGAVTVVVSLLAPMLAAVISWPTYALAHLVVVLVGIFG